MYGVPLGAFSDDIVAMLPRSTCTYRLPLDFFRWVKHSGIVGSVVIEIGLDCEYICNR
jgi:hypothetical protein